MILNHAGQWDIVVDDIGHVVAPDEASAADAKTAALAWLRQRIGADVVITWEPAGDHAFLGEWRS